METKQNSKNVICLENAVKEFGKKRVLSNVNLTVEEGEIIGLLGPSGAGKTTLIKILTGQLGYEGNARLFGRDCSGLENGDYQRIGMVLDDCGLYERLTIMDNMMLFAGIHRAKKSDVVKALEQVGLTDSKTPAGKLSKGMKQRLVLARAVLHKPDILFLDEPTSGLDPVTARQIHKMILGFRESGMTVFLTTHNMEEAHKLCDHVALLNEGTIVEYGIPEELCRKYNEGNRINILLKNGESIQLKHDPDCAEALREVFAQDKVASIHSSEPNLEEVFIKLTGRRLENE